MLVVVEILPVPYIVNPPTVKQDPPAINLGLSVLSPGARTRYKLTPVTNAGIDPPAPGGTVQLVIGILGSVITVYVLVVPPFSTLIW